jgi:glycine cleavage system aminomethyltransferase T/glycine/D-amino acid oxidase-like deaminating enzyme
MAVGPENEDAAVATRKSGPPSEAQVLIVGGGIAGCSLAYQLCALGVEGVVLLEQNKVGGGTTWHAAGAVGRMRTTVTLARLNDRSAALYSRMEEESGLPTGWRKAGSLTVARKPERMIQLRRAGSMAGRFGVSVEEVGPDELRARFPLAELDDVIGGVWLADDGIVDPPALAEAIAEAARRRGARIVEGVSVTGLLENAGTVTGVQCGEAAIRAETVVLCCGMWTRQLAATSGIDVPLQPVEHHYVLSRSVGEDITGLPVTRDPDASIYFRGKGEALMLGAFQRVSKPWLVDHVPEDFSFRLLEPDWEHFAPPLEEGLRRLPALRELGIERFVNGPESFTPDGNPLVGEMPEMRGLYICAAFNSSGLAYAGGVAEALAQWLVGKEPPYDLWPVDVRRFHSRQADLGYLRTRSVEVLGTHMRMAYPNVEFEMGRRLRVTPLYDELAERGASFGEKHGLERPNWFARGGQKPVNEYSFGRQNWFENSRDEHLATRSAAAVFDQSGFAKYRVSGPDAVSLLQHACANDVDVDVGKVVYTAMLTARGTFASDLTVMRTDDRSYLVVSGTAQAVADRAWLSRFVSPNVDVVIEDVTDQYAVLGIMGPASREILQSLTDADLSNQAFPFSTTRTLTIGDTRVRAIRLTYVGELGWELHIPRDEAVSGYRAILQAGESRGLVNGGHYAINSLRLEKGYRAWGADITMSDTPLEAGLGFAVAWDKKTPFYGRDALLAQRNGPGPRKRLVSLVLDDPEPVLWGGELVYRDGVSAGHTTSGAYGYTLGAAVALAWLDASEGPLTVAAVEASSYEVDIAGDRASARASLSSPFDPKRTRILC